MTTKTEFAAAADKAKAKRYSKDFQLEAVRILEAGRSLAQLSRELGVSTWSLRRWTQQHGAAKAAPSGSHGRGSTSAAAVAIDPSAVSLAVQLAEVREELRLVTRQREILKKALAILGQESPSAIF